MHEWCGTLEAYILTDLMRDQAMSCSSFLVEKQEVVGISYAADIETHKGVVNELVEIVTIARKPLKQRRKLQQRSRLPGASL